MEKKINFKGFNLFSIIVAATLLMIGTILISTLVSTEETTSVEIYTMTSDFELSDAASLARADAIQTFNYQFRKEIQNYLNYSGGKIDNPGFTILRTTEDYSTFEEIIESFERVILLTDPTEGDVNNLASVIDSISRRTIDSFPEGRYGKYMVDISDTSSIAINNTTNIILSAITKDYEGGNRFLDVVGCDVDTCDIGSFYFNIPLHKIDPIDYERLPKIVVRDITTNEEMKIPLLPRSNLKIYIPLRFFKAIHHAKDNLQAVDFAEPRIANARLGYCDGPSCIPREHPLNPTAENWDNQCRASQNLNPEIEGVGNYDSGGTSPGTFALISFAKSEICAEYGIGGLSPPEADFKNYNDFLASDNATPRNILGCGFYRITVLLNSLPKKGLVGVGDPDLVDDLFCNEIIGIRADVIFKETNPQYLVDGEEILYKIRINSGNLTRMSEGSLGSCRSGASPSACNVA